jgi:hypothetical protein
MHSEWPRGRSGIHLFGFRKSDHHWLYRVRPGRGSHTTYIPVLGTNTHTHSRPITFIRRAPDSRSTVSTQMATSHYKIVSRWENVKDSDRRKVKRWITDLVGYPCKLACQPNEGVVDIYVFSESKGEVTDWLEIQPSGAIGVVFEQYADPDADAVGELSDRCETYNEEAGVVFVSDSDSEDSDDESGSEDEAETEEETADTK